jgi:hypothetical protein
MLRMAWPTNLSSQPGSCDSPHSLPWFGATVTATNRSAIGESAQIVLLLGLGGSPLRWAYCLNANNVVILVTATAGQITSSEAVKLRGAERSAKR